MARSPPDNYSKPRRLDVHPPVFFISAGLIVLFVVLTLVSLESTDAFFSTTGRHREIRALVSGARGQHLPGGCRDLLFSQFAHIRLGGPDSKPEFGYWSWFSMLFSAGMGIGLLFYSAAEPM